MKVEPVEQSNGSGSASLKVRLSVTKTSDDDTGDSSNSPDDVSTPLNAGNAESAVKIKDDSDKAALSVPSQSVVKMGRDSAG